MESDPLVPDAGPFRHWITDVNVTPGSTDPNCKFGAKIFVDEQIVCNLPWIENAGPLTWSGLLICDVSSSSTISLRLCKVGKESFSYYDFPPISISEVDQETGGSRSTLDLPEAAWTATLKSLSSMAVEQLFQGGLDQFNSIEGVFNSYKPKETAKYLFKNALQFSSFFSKVLPKYAAKRSFLVCMKAWELLERQSNLEDTVRAILNGMIRVCDITEIVSQASKAMLVTTMDRVKKPINGILTILEDVSIFIINQSETNSLAHISHKGMGPNNPFDVEAYLTRLKNLQKEFYTMWLSSITTYTFPMDVADKGGCLPRENIQAVANEPTITKESYEIFNLLGPVQPSGYDPDQACMDGTREAILNKVITWTQNNDSLESFMWISGQAGMGKTSIAASLCRWLDNARALAGSFFCQYDDPKYNDPLSLVNNLVYDFAMHCSAYAHEVAKEIRENRGLCNAHLSLRFERLFKKPLERLCSLSTPNTLIAVVDGLDMCGDFNSRRRIFHELYDISKLVPWLKIIITARPEADIQEHFRRHCAHEPVIYLQTYDASGDIHAYIQYHLGELSNAEGWDDRSIGQLCVMAEGVFLWAALATQYLRESSIPTQSRLRKILENCQSAITDHFDRLYLQALKTAMKDDEDETREAYKKCIGAIVACSERDALAIQDLEHILLAGGGIERGTLAQVIINLGPLVYVTVGQCVRFHHSSFKSYITDPLRTLGSPVQIQGHEADLANCCFKLMEKELRFNIGQLETSYLLNSKIPDLEHRVRSYIRPPLKYACLHWISHFIAAPDRALVKQLKGFFEIPQFMYWIEVLSLMDHMKIAISTFSVLSSLELAQLPYGSLVAFWAKDAHRFIISYYDVIASSTPHLYLSALAFAPTRSLIAQRMRPYFPNTIKLVRGNLTWHPCVQSVLHPHPIQSLSISPDGLRLAVGYPDGSIGLRDIKTGACIRKPLVGHSASVTCIAFSPNGNYLVSGSYDATIRMWNLPQDVETSHVLTGHCGPVHTIAFSPDGLLIASGSSDKTIRLWDAKTMKPISQSSAGNLRISSIAFSPDGTRLASGSWDKSIRLWSVNLNDLQLGLNPIIITQCSDSITSIAFSPDGSKLASGSVGRTLQMWDTQTGSEVGAHTSCPMLSNSITSIAFSSNGKLVLCSSSDGAIQLWDAMALLPFTQPFGHSSRVNGVAFTPDGSYVISGSTDMSTRVWEVNACPKSMATTTLVGHSGSIYSVAISSDGTRIISGSRDSTVRMWEAQSGASIGDPFVGHTSPVVSVVFSPDGTQILSGSEDKTLKLWSATTQTLIHSYEHKAALCCAVFSTDGAMIVFGSEDCNIYLKDSFEQDVIGYPFQGHSHHVLSVDFSPDGAFLASASADRSIILWDVKTHSRLREPLLGHTDTVGAVVFSPCGTQVVSGSEDKTVRVWDVETGGATHILDGHSSDVTSVAFSPNGSFIASSSLDYTVRVWNAKAGCVLGQPLAGHSHRVWALTLSPDGSYIISGSADETIRVWDASTANSLAGSTKDLPGAFCWPANPYELIPHPRHPSWITNDQKSLIFWLPLHYRQPELFFNAHTQASSPQALLDYSKFKQGTAWAEVACDSIRRMPE